MARQWAPRFPTHGADHADPLPLALRAIAACSAAAITFVLFNAVESISEPQRSVLVAKTRHPGGDSFAAEVLTVAVA